jgi:shikimate dehydrogenase
MTVIRAGLIGAGIGQSRFAAALDVMCRANGLELEFTAIDTALRPEFDFARTVDDLRAQGWTGVTVTHPHKVQARDYAGASMHPEFRDLGAANTLTFHPELAGHNTDFSGFLAAWHGVMSDRSPGHVAIAGAGGVSRAIAPALLRLGATRLSIWDSVPEQAAALAADLGANVTAVPFSDSPDVIRTADGLVNATPLGMTGHPGSAFPKHLIGPQRWAFDAVYTPTDTAFLRASCAKGLKTLTGFDLFRFMAIRSFVAYTGIFPDSESTLRSLDTLRPREIVEESEG